MTNKELALLLEEKGHSIDTSDNLEYAISDSEEILANYEVKLHLDHQLCEAFYNNISEGINYLYENGFISKSEVLLFNLLVYIGNIPSKKIIKYKLEKIRKIIEDYPSIINKNTPLNIIDSIEESIDLIDEKCREYFEHLGGLDKEGQYKRKLMKIKRKRDRKE